MLVSSMIYIYIYTGNWTIFGISEYRQIIIIISYLYSISVGILYIMDGKGL